MTDRKFDFTRRQTLAGFGAVSAFAIAGANIAPAMAAPAKRPHYLTNDLAISTLEKFAYEQLAHEPERATDLGVDTGKYAGLRSKLKDQSLSGQAAYAATLRNNLEIAHNLYPKEGLYGSTHTSMEVVKSAYSTALDGFALPYGDVAVGSWRNSPYVVIQNVGTYIDMGRFMDSSHPIETQEDASAYLSRLSALPSALDGELERMQAARAMGLVPPDFLLAKTITQMEMTLEDAQSGGSLVSSLTDKIIKKFGKEGLDKKDKEARRIVTKEIAPALQRQLDELKKQAASATGDPGLWARPKGDEWYAWGLRASTTTKLTPDEVHEEGLEELAALHAQMDPILKEIGYTSGTVGERMTALSEDPRYKFAEGDAGRAEIMEFLKERTDWILAQMPRAFSNPLNPNFEIRRIPPNEELGAPGAYGGPGSKDGSIPGRMWINLRSTDLHRKYDLADLAYHETIPGHVWQGEYSNTLPLIRSILGFNAFSEGWALYAEQIADELGAYDDFKVGRLGYLQSLAFRACRMVVDTGLHHKRWSREQAVNFFVERNGSKPDEVASEVDRYCSWAGQACGYKVGHSQIVRQRERAQKTLGEDYDFKAFNDAVIGGGNAPLDVMAGNVSKYIEDAQWKTRPVA